MNTIDDAVHKLAAAWPHIVAECRQVLGSELHYQAVAYHCLRVHAKVPIGQLGMNVKMWITDPVSDLFKERGVRKKEEYRGGFEPIPDICLFSPQVCADWRRRNAERTLAALLLAMEVKVSERQNGRLSGGEIVGDIKKLAAHRQEAEARGSSFLPVVMVIDVAPDSGERMTPQGIAESQAAALKLSVGFMYVSPSSEISNVQYGGVPKDNDQPSRRASAIGTSGLGARALSDEQMDVEVFDSSRKNTAAAELKSWISAHPNGFYISLSTSSRGKIHSVGCYHLGDLQDWKPGQWDPCKKAKVCSQLF